jgi:Protein of unknown function (DUF2384)
MRETERFQARLAELVAPETIPAWLDTPNPALDGLKPLEVIERGEIDRLWNLGRHRRARRAQETLHGTVPAPRFGLSRVANRCRCCSRLRGSSTPKCWSGERLTSTLLLAGIRCAFVTYGGAPTKVLVSRAREPVVSVSPNGTPWHATTRSKTAIQEQDFYLADTRVQPWSRPDCTAPS